MFLTPYVRRIIQAHSCVDFFPHRHLFSSNPGTFITVLSGWSAFLSPMTGIVVSDYFLVRHGEYHIGDMYLGNSESAYWYTFGFNFRGFLAWVCGMAPLLRK